MAEQKNNRPQPPVRPGGGGPGHMGGMPIEKAKNRKGTLIRLLKYLGGSKFVLLILLILVVISAGASVYTARYQQSAVDSIAVFDAVKGIGVNWELLKTSLIIFGSLYIISIVFNFFQGWFGATLAQRVVRQMRNDLFKKITSLPVKFHDTHTHGELMSRLTNDIDNVSNTLSSSITMLFSSAVTVIMALALMLSYSWLMTLITVLAVPAGIFATKIVTKKTRENFKLQQSALGNLNGHIEESVTGQKTIEAFNHEKAAIDKFDKINADLRKHSVNAQIYSGMVGPIMNVVGNIGFVLVAVSGTLIALSNPAFTVGVISAFITLSKQFTRPISEIANQYNTLQSALAGAERVFEIFDTASESDDGKKTLDLDTVKGDVVFDSVNFGYKDNVIVLKDFSINVKAGQKIALVGPTGAGKTTVVNLITRFYDINSGEITLDGTELRDYTKKSLRSSIGIVLQDTVLFTGTIRDNIRFGRLDATDDEVIEAAKTANAADFIERLPEGYDTQLSESGSNLSQGQRQLLSIARAVLANPKILILDEATSSIDTRTEMHVQQAMINLMQNRTSFIIAHRLSTIRDADTILVINDGRIVEKGNHSELLAQHGAYYTLYQTQFANT